MDLTPEQKRRLIETYEPILYFHKDERWTPVKPEAYVESSALYCTQPADKNSRHDKENWGACQRDQTFPRKPLIPRDGISVSSAEDVEGASDPDGDGVNEFYLGHQSADGFRPYAVSNDDRMVWFENAGWADNQEVTNDSLNQETDVDNALNRWRNEAKLSDATDTYYAEVEDMERLQSLLDDINSADGIDLRDIVKTFTGGDSVVIWYYFLYPVHEENFGGCKDDPDQPGHGNYQGDWNAVAVLLPDIRLTHFRDEGSIGWEPFPEPEWIGYGQRTRGLADIPFLEQQTLAMANWAEGEVRRVGLHPKVYVGSGSHNNYSNPGDHTPYQQDLLASACGAADDVTEALEDKIDELEDKVEHTKTVVVTVAKIAAGAGIGALFGPIGAAIGAGIGAIAAGIEAAVGASGGDSGGGSDPVDPDFTPDASAPENDYGLVLIPQSIAAGFPDQASATEVRPWKFSVNDKLVIREEQIWWPPEKETRGYSGRWGAMCQVDPRDKRSGMPFPDFRRKFFIDFARHLSE